MANDTDGGFTLGKSKNDDAINQGTKFINKIYLGLPHDKYTFIMIRSKHV